jgi:hypothetical protein
MYGYPCVHYVIRWLMHAVAVETGHDPDRLSFTRTLRAARRPTASDAELSPKHSLTSIKKAAQEVLFGLLPARRVRSHGRVVKRSMSNYGRLLSGVRRVSISAVTSYVRGMAGPASPA